MRSNRTPVPSRRSARQRIGDNLRSVAVQTYPRIEHIVVDGREAGPRVRWKSEPDRGQSDAINKAFAESRGDGIGWLNSDDAYFTSETVACVVDAFGRNPDADVVYGHAALVNSAGLVLRVKWVPPRWARLLPVHDFIIQPAAFIRRRVLGDFLVNPEFESGMDWELWLRLSNRCRFIRLDRILAIDRYQPHRKSMTRPDLADRDLIRLRAIHHIPSRPWVRPTRKAFQVAFRLAGSAREPEVMGAHLAFDGHVDGLGSFVHRHVAVPQSRMPFEDEQAIDRSHP